MKYKIAFVNCDDLSKILNFLSTKDDILILVKKDFHIIIKSKLLINELIKLLSCVKLEKPWSIRKYF